MILMGFFDEFYKLMLVSQYFITQRRTKSELCFPKSDNKYLRSACSNNKHKIIVYLLPKQKKHC